LFEKGDGVAEDPGEAVRWYKMAADQGNASAHLHLGLMFQEGRGVAQNKDEAMRYFEALLNQGD